MASETTDPPTGQQSQSSKSSEDDHAGETQSEDTPDSDPATKEILKDTVGESSEIIDQATSEHLKETT
jgi:hypothetical protein